MPRRLSVLLLLSALVAAADADPWPRFRGPNGSGVGHAPELPLSWGEDDYLWKVDLPGLGYSSPVTWGARVFVTSALENDATGMLFALDARSGAKLWKRDFPSKPHPKHKFNSYASSTPAVDAQRVYCLWATPASLVAVALEQADGKEVWRRDLGPFPSQHGFGGSPIVVDGLVIVSSDHDGASFVAALDARDGAVRWKTDRRSEKAGYATPLVYRPDEARPQLVLTSWAQGFSSLDLQTGAPLWELPVFANRTVGSPTLAAGLVFAAAGEGGVGKQMFAVRPGIPEKNVPAKVAYAIEGKLPYVAVPVACEDLVFLWQDHGVVTCLDGPTGKSLWQERIGGNYFASPIRVGRRLYNATREGEMVVLAAERRFEPLARFRLGDRTYSTPAVADGVMYLRTFGRIAAIGPRRPQTPPESKPAAAEVR